MTIEELQEMFKTEFKKLTDLLEKQKVEVTELGATKETTAKEIEKVGKQVEEIQTAMKKASDDLEAKTLVIAKTSEEMDEKIKKFEEGQKRLDELEIMLQRPGFGGNGGEQIKTPGQLFIESAQFKKLIETEDVNCAPVNVKSFYVKADELISAITGGNLAVPFRFPSIIAPPERVMRIRDLLTVQSTTTNAIDYVEETGFTNEAAPVAEGAAKPQSKLEFELKTEAVKTVAHWIPVSRQVLADVAAIRGYVDTRLVYGLKLTEEAQLLYGNGVSPNLTGLMVNTGIQSYSWSGGTVGDTKLDCIRRAMTLARVAEYPVTGLVLNPNDWEDIELLKGSDEHYIWIVVTEGGVPRVFRTPVVDTTAIVSGEALVGAFALGAYLWDRELATVRISEHHEDFFIKNLVCVLAEERLALTTFRPQAFVKITFDSAPAES